ncbi:MAG: 5'/3'-nucleotidase SurE [Acidimicrobiales bacterium]
MGALLVRVLVTNDDGVEAPGLHVLAREIAKSGCEVTVVSPSSDHSGFGAALGPLHISGRVAFERRSVAALADLEVIAVEGPPALCVFSACLGGFGERPDLVVSGINAGANTGRAVLHSGTVGAALTANSFGVPSIAVSEAFGESFDWRTAALVAASLTSWMTGHEKVFTLNVNVPNNPARGIPAHIATLDVGGEVQTAMFEADEGTLELRFTPTSARPGTDSSILAEGAIAITPLTALATSEIVLHGALGRIDRALATEDRQRIA